MSRLLAVGCAFLVLSAPAASAQGFISPFLGTTFSKPPLEACSISGCRDGQSTVGVSAGSLGSAAGFELDFGYTKAFFGEAGDTSTSGALTVMANLLLGPKIGAVQPYGLAGLGLMRLKIDSITSSLTREGETKLAWDIGGGVFVLFGRVGIRGDIRHVRGLQDLEVLAFTIEGSSLRFNRASAALVLKF